MRQRGLAAEIDAMWMETYIGIGVMVVLSVVWPVFLLVWFARARIRREVAAWEEERAL